MDANSTVSEDGRKKRDNTEVVEESAALKAEKKKKKSSSFSLPSTPKNSSRDKDSVSNKVNNQEDEEEEDDNDDVDEEEVAKHDFKDSSDDEKESERVFWDLESALQHVVRLGDGQSIEHISQDKRIRFRVAHAGDASVIASMYRKMKELENERTSPEEEDAAEEKETLGSKLSLNVESSQSADDDAFEVSLTQSLGDEDTPPCIFALIVDILSEDQPNDTEIGAIAMFNSSWEGGDKVLRIEWIYINSKLSQAHVIERRLWLRLATLSVMTGLAGVAINKFG